MKDTILLIDGHSILNRAFYGLPLLTNAKGLHTNAVYGFLNILFKAIEDIAPRYIAVAFDLSAPTFRHEMYEAYKGTRKQMPEELREQVPVIKDVLKAMNICLLQKEGFEADDMIGSACKMAKEYKAGATILSGDKDLLQLVNESVTLMLPKTSKGTTVVEVFTPKRVEEVFGFSPEHIVDFKAMMGDSSDNIPGLPGVGQKTASELIIKYGTLENAHEHREEKKKKKARTAFEESYESGLLSKRLATIKTDVKLEFSIEDLRLRELYTKEAYGIFKELGFKNFLTRFDESARSEQKMSKTLRLSGLKAAFEAVKKASSADSVGFYLDIEGERAKGLALALCDECVYISAEGEIGEEKLRSLAKEVLKSSLNIYTMDFKEQQNILRAETSSKLFDCVVAAYLIDPLRSEYTYEYIAAQYGGASLSSAEEIVNAKITKKTVITDEQREKIALLKAYSAYISAKALDEKLKEQGMSKLFYEIETPLIYTLSDMETAGIKMNADELAAFSSELQDNIDKLEKKIYEQAGEEFNIQSPKQLGYILFEKLKLSGGKKTKSGYSTAADVLEKLVPTAPIVADILKYRQYFKLRSTYAEALGGYVKEDGRIHSHFQQTVTATGRLSSTDPNMQNIPVRMELGRNIRRVFVPKDGYIFIDADYSQIELRVLAHMSGDEKLIEAYRQDSDIHKITASQVFDVPLDEVTPIQRRNAKAVNFGIVYGISSFGLSQDLSITRKEAQEYINKYFETYPGIKRFLDKSVEGAKKNGYTTTLFGRRRPMPELSSSNFMQRSFGERVAMNSPIQGSAADIIKIAMNSVNRRLKEEGLDARLILQVHDELLVEAKSSEKDAVCALLREAMEGAAKLSVDLVVDMNMGLNWDEAH